MNRAQTCSQSQTYSSGLTYATPSISQNKSISRNISRSVSNIQLACCISSKKKDINIEGRQLIDKMPVKVCPQCKGTTLEETGSGEVVCTNCGQVVDDSSIVAEVTFGETSSGAAMVQGMYIGEGQSA